MAATRAEIQAVAKIKKEEFVIELPIDEDGKDNLLEDYLKSHYKISFQIKISRLPIYQTKTPSSPCVHLLR